MGILKSQPSPRALNIAFFTLLALGAWSLSPVYGGAIPKSANEPHKPVDIKLSKEEHFDKEKEHNPGSPSEDICGFYDNLIG